MHGWGGDCVHSLLKRGIPTRVATRMKDFRVSADSIPENMNLASVVFADVRIRYLPQQLPLFMQNASARFFVKIVCCTIFFV